MCSISLCCGSEWNADVTLAREEAENHKLSEQLKDATINLRNEKRTTLHMGREKWNNLTLAFPDVVIENAYMSYFNLIRKEATRSSILLVSFSYILFQIFSWQASSIYDLMLRGGYVILLLSMFASSFSDAYSRNVQMYSLVVASFTFLEALAEATILAHLISPYTIIILVILLLMWTVFVRFRFIYTLSLCLIAIVPYNVICFVLLGGGHIHIYVDGKGGLVTLLLYYNAILILVAISVCKMAHRFETSSRYNFLSYCSKIYESREAWSPSTDSPNRRKTYETAEHLLGIRKSMLTASDEGHYVNGETLTSGEKMSATPSPNSRNGKQRRDRHLSSPLLAGKVGSYTTFSSEDSADEEGAFGQNLTPRGSRGEKGLSAAWGRIKSAHNTRGFSAGLGLISNTEQILRHSGAEAKNYQEFLSRDSAFDDLISPKIVDVDNLPYWLAPYPYIDSGYRVYYNISMCFSSIFQWHNETMNIWTEIFPCICFVAYSIDYLLNNEVILKAPAADRIIIIIGLSGALILRPILSAGAHTFSIMSSYHYVLWWGIDYFSICIAIVCSSLVYSHFTFYCQPQQYIFYVISTVGLLISTLLAVVYVASPGVRVGSFLLLILLANVMPLTWQIVIQITSKDEGLIVPPDYLIQWGGALGIMLLGLIIKSSLIPEICTTRNRFDYVFNSHNWWHLCINGGFILMFPAITTYLEWREQTVCPSK